MCEFVLSYVLVFQCVCVRVGACLCVRTCLGALVS